MQEAPAKHPRRFMAGIAFGLLFTGLLCVSASPSVAKIEPEASRTFYESAVKEVARGNLRAAVIELKNALQRNPDNADARLLLGEVYLKFGDGAAAEKELRAAERRGIPSERLAVPVAQALLLQRKFDELIDSVDVSGQRPDVAFQLRLLRADAYAGLRQFGEARAAYLAAGKENAEDARVPLGLARIELADGKLDAARGHAEAAQALEPASPEARLLVAEIQRQGGSPEAAVPIYQQILAGAPAPSNTTLNAHIGLAAALITLGRDAEAQSELTAAEEILPNAPLTVYLKALIHLRMGEYDQARRILEGSAWILDGFTPAHFLIGAAHFALGDLESARAWLNRHIQAHPQNLQARKLLGATLLRLGATEEALRSLQAGLNQAPQDPQLLLLLGNVYLRQGETAKATEVLERATELAPQDARILRQLAISQVARGQNEAALANLNATLDLGADVSAVGFALTFIHLRSGAFEDALKLAETLRQRYPQSAVAANLEGGAHAALDQFAEAQASFQEALEIDPTFDEARANLAALKAKAGDFAGAETEYRKILQNDEASLPAMLGLAAMADLRDDSKATRNWLERAVAANPKASKPSLALTRHLSAAGETAAARRVLASYARHVPATPQALVELGAAQRQVGDTVGAIDTFRRLVSVTGGAADAQSLLAQAQLAAGEPQAARHILEASLAQHSDHRPTAEALVHLVSQEEGLPAGIAYAQKLRTAYPKAPWRHRIVGDVQWRAGHLEEAIATYEAGWEVQPSSALATVLSRAYLQQARQRRSSGEVALEPLERWLDEHPDDDSVRLALADTHLSLGNLDASRSAYEDLTETQNSNPTVWNNLAWLYQQSGDQRALSYAERALALAPGNPGVLDTLGWILIDHGQIERAASLLEQAHLATPSNGDIAYHYAVALYRNGDEAAAGEVLQQLLRGSQAFAARTEATELLQRLTKQ